MSGLVILDRDGVLNAVVIDAEHGTIDSPLNPDQIEVFPWVPRALARLTQKGYDLHIATNQPAAAKGKTTLNLLQKTHDKIVALAGSEGALISSSQICFHRSEDHCECRKPKTKLLENAWLKGNKPDKSMTWMVGDGVTDIQAAASFGVKKAFLGPQKCDACKVLDDKDLKPDFWGKNLEAFVNYLLGEKI